MKIGQIDITRCRRAMNDLRVKGTCGSKKRRDVIEEAIAAIQEDGETALKDNPLGVKNYASFGDQRFNLSGTPKHGHIVFRVSRRNVNSDVELGADHIYLLECVRDVEPMKVRDRSRPLHKKEYKYLNLCQIIDRRLRYQDAINGIDAHLEEQEVGAHVPNTEASATP